MHTCINKAIDFSCDQKAIVRRQCMLLKSRIAIVISKKKLTLALVKQKFFMLQYYINCSWNCTLYNKSLGKILIAYISTWILYFIIFFIFTLVFSEVTPSVFILSHKIFYSDILLFFHKLEDNHQMSYLINQNVRKNPEPTLEHTGTRFFKIQQ